MDLVDNFSGGFGIDCFYSREDIDGEGRIWNFSFSCYGMGTSDSLTCKEPKRARRSWCASAGYEMEASYNLSLGAKFGWRDLSFKSKLLRESNFSRLVTLS